MDDRLCAVCGESQARRKVWEKRGKRVICMRCGQQWTFNAYAVPRRLTMVSSGRAALPAASVETTRPAAET